jgi:hypothetical protein
MKKHVITIEDMPDGGVSVTSSPALGELAELIETPDRMTRADVYAARAHAALLSEAEQWREQR